MARIMFLLAMASFLLSVNGLTGNTLLRELTVNEGLKDGQLLLSQNEIFALGFFSPRRNTNRYLGMWYKTINETVVWVANRNMAIPDSTGVLTLGSDGALHLKDGSGNSYWSTNSQSVKNPKASLLDTGNLVVTDTSSPTLLWQSFDQPCDTLLPRMIMGHDSAFSHERYLQSWKDENDPSLGDYIHKLDQKRHNELVILFKGTTLKYRSGPWDGERWNGMPEMQQRDILKFNLSSDNYQGLYWYETNSTSNFWRLVMGPDGIVNRTYNSSNDWKSFWYVPNNLCAEYTKCGPYGICSNNDCQCLAGFEPESKDRWDIRDFSRGCKRKDPLEYSKNDRFRMFSQVKLPDTLNATIYPSNKNLGDCKNLCSTNASCMAYTVMGFTGCVIWVGDLVDIVQFPPVQFPSGGGDLYVRVSATSFPEPSPNPSTESKSGSKLSNSLIIVVPTIVVLLLLGVGIFFWRRTHNVTPRSTTEFEPSPNAQDVKIFEFNALRTSTGDFSNDNKLGEGQFGPVYKGVIEGQEIAVKRLSRTSDQGIEQLKNEVKLLANLKHINLVKLLGYCIHQQEMLLCYEYLPNGSLDQLLFEKNSNTHSQLDWENRYKIIEGVSYGLLYLHEENGTNIVIHRDIKPSNILLDKRMVPKISDFGLAKLFDEDGSFIKVSTVAGTRGYMAPEIQHGMLSLKSDVYSFGILMLETIIGCKNTSYPASLVDHVYRLKDEGRFVELTDPRLKDTCPLEEIKRCIDIALLCLSEQPDNRPSMRDVNLMLSSKSTDVRAPHPSTSSWGLRAFDTSESGYTN